MFTLRNKRTGEFARWWTQSNDNADFAVSSQFYIEFWKDGKLWCVDTLEEVEQVLQKSTEWYNAGYYTPTWDNSFKKAVLAGEVEIYEFNLERRG